MPLNLNLKKGALTKTVEAKFGAKGFTPEGKIKTSILDELKNSKNPTTKKRATLAEVMRTWKH